MDEDKFFKYFMAVLIVIMAVILGVMVLSLVLAAGYGFWNISLTAKIVWVAVIYGLWRATKFTHDLIERNDWL